MIFSRARYVRFAHLAPFFPDEPVLDVEPLVFLPAYRGVEGCVGGRREKRRTYFQRGSFVEAHVAIHRRCLDDLRQVVQAADRHRGADDLLRQDTFGELPKKVVSAAMSISGLYDLTEIVKTPSVN